MNMVTGASSQQICKQPDINQEFSYNPCIGTCHRIVVLALTVCTAFAQTQISLIPVRVIGPCPNTLTPKSCMSAEVTS